MFDFSSKKTLIYIISAYIISILFRLLWIYQYGDNPQYIFHNQYMINTNDGYFWAEGARDILNGITELSSDDSPINYACSKLTVFFVKILPFSFETIIFYMPAFLSSLVVVPLILIGKTLKMQEVGFIAAIFASIAWSYYNRTMLGYYDTDMLNIVLPLVLLWSIISSIKTQKYIFLIITAIDIIIYRWWYPQSYSLEFSFWGVLFIYFIYLNFIKKDISFSNYVVFLLTFMMIAMVQLDAIYRVVLVVSLYIVLKYKKEIVQKGIYYLFILSIVLFFATGGFEPIYAKLKGYVFQDDILMSKDLGLHYYTVMKTIREASQIPFEIFAYRVSGSVFVFLLSFVGYIWLLYKKPIFLLSLPMAGLGFLALSGGLRFTIYLVPIFAFSLAFLLWKLVEYIDNKRYRYIALSVLFIATLYPNIKHILEYRVGSVFFKSEVEVFDRLKDIASRDDYVVAWWDYGYPIRFYSDVKTLIDGGSHRGVLNFPVSYALLEDQKSSYYMQKLAVYYNEKRYKKILNNEESMYPIEMMIVDQNYSDPNSFLNDLKEGKLNKNIKLDRDIYLYLPNRMLNILPTIELFSNIDLKTGAKRYNSFFYLARNISEDQRFIYMDKIRYDKYLNLLNISNSYNLPIKEIITTYYGKDMKLHKSRKLIDKNADISIIFMKNYGQVIILSQKLLESTYIQLFVLENYDKNLYEPKLLTPLVKIYKLK